MSRRPREASDLLINPRLQSSIIERTFAYRRLVGTLGLSVGDPIQQPDAQPIVGKLSPLTQQGNPRRQLVGLYLKTPDLQVRFRDWIELIHLEVILKEPVVQRTHSGRVTTFRCHVQRKPEIQHITEKG